MRMTTRQSRTVSMPAPPDACRGWKPAPLGGGRGFTLVELFVVISIALIIVAVALPAFSAMAYSSNRSLAQNMLRQGVRMARDVSVQSVRGGDGAAVFLFDPETGTTRIISAEWVGTIMDSFDGNRSRLVERDVFAPVASGELIELPRYWMVRGYAPPRFTASAGMGLGFDWYDSDLYLASDAWDRGHWVFPENGFYDIEGDPNAPTLRGRTMRQSFMIRFDTQTGQVRRDGREALFVDARPSATFRDRVASSRNDPKAGLRLDWAESATAWAHRVLTTGDLTQDGLAYQLNDEELRRELIGNESFDTVLVQDVARIALYDERDLAAALGARQLDRRRGTEQTNSIYAAFEDARGISIDYEGLFEEGPPFADNANGHERLRESIDRWINGDTDRNDDGTVGDGTLFDVDDPDSAENEGDEPAAMRFIVDAFSGELIEVTR